MIAPIDVARLPGPAQKILDPNGPAPLKAMAAKGLFPGLKPADVLAVLLVLSQGEGPNAETAKNTLAALPAPVLNGAFAGDLHPAVLDVLAQKYANNQAVAEKVLGHPAIDPSSVAELAGVADENVCELIATNEERLLAHPDIIERLYVNKSCRMSTADRLLELAVRHGLELKIPAFSQAKAAIEGELVLEPTPEPTFDDVQFADAQTKAADIALGEDEDTHAVNAETGQEEVVDKAKPLHAVWAELRPPAKIRLLTIGSLKRHDREGREIDSVRYDAKALRLLGIRDGNPLVAVAALDVPGINDNDVLRISAMRNVCQEVLNAIAINREWTRHYLIKYNLVANPRTPFAQAAKYIVHIRENDLKTLAKSRDVSGAVQTAVRQQLQRKGKKSS